MYVLYLLTMVANSRSPLAAPPPTYALTHTESAWMVPGTVSADD